MAAPYGDICSFGKSAMATLERNELHYGDNLTVMQARIPDEIADLIYLDPPFNSARNYNLLFKQVKGDASPAQIMAFEDTWTWSPRLYDEFKADERNARLFTLINALYDILGGSEMMAYVLMMAPRLLELHKKLKPTGSLYLHCDPAASHYLKIILDVIFGPENFHSEIIWRRTNAHNKTTRQYGPIHDVIHYYSKTSNYTFHPGFRPYTRAYIGDRFLHQDERGRYQTNYLTGPETRNGESGREWRGYNPTRAGRHWAVPQSLREFLPGNGAGMSSHEQLEELYQQGFVLFPKKEGGQPMYKQYMGKGVPYQDLWAYQPTTRGVLFDSDEHIDEDVKWLENEPERRGYATQKPLGLLARMLETSSEPGDVVFDPFCGCGTAIVAAERMNRKWIGIDVTYLAISEVVYRLETEGRTDRALDYRLIGTPTDALGAAKLFEQTAPQSHKPFEQFCVSLVRGEYREQKGADRGIDGVIHLWDVQGKLRKIVVQVKGGNALNLSNVRDFASVIKDNDAVMGLMISMRPPTKEMQLVCEQQGSADWPSQRKYPKMQIRTVKDLLEEPRNPFEIPDSYRVEKSQGVGKKEADAQMGMELE